MARSTLETTPLAEIVRHDFRAGAILDEYNLDFCCGGALSLADACQQRGIEVERVVAQIESLAPSSLETPNDDPVALIAHIVDTHHSYVRQSLPGILDHLSKVVAAHASRHPELAFIESQFSQMAERPAAASRQGRASALSVHRIAGRCHQPQRPTPTRHVRHGAEPDPHDGNRASGGRRSNGRHTRG